LLEVDYEQRSDFQNRHEIYPCVVIIPKNNKV
jgi:hypothetical protein